MNIDLAKRLAPYAGYVLLCLYMLMPEKFVLWALIPRFVGVHSNQDHIHKRVMEERDVPCRCRVCRDDIPTCYYGNACMYFSMFFLGIAVDLAGVFALVHGVFYARGGLPTPLVVGYSVTSAAAAVTIPLFLFGGSANWFYELFESISGHKPEQGHDDDVEQLLNLDHEHRASTRTS